MIPKFYRTELRKDRTTVCPWCETVNQHKTGNDCGHVAKITKKGIVFYYWGFRPANWDGIALVIPIRNRIGESK